jgi:MFS family permease
VRGTRLWDPHDTRAVRSKERRAVGTLAFIHGLVHGNILAIPVFLAFAWREEFSLDPVSMGGLAAVAYACFGLGSVPFGRIADLREARPVLGACVAGIALSMAGLAASTSLLTTTAALAALGLSSSIYHPTGLAFISRHVREPGRGMGWHGMGGSLGVALGPALAGGLIGLGVPWRFIAGGLSLPAVAALALLALQGPEPVRPVLERRGLGPTVRGLLTPAFGFVLLVYMLAGIAYWGSLTFLPGLVGPASFAFLLALGAVGQVVSGFLAESPRRSRILFGLSALAAAVLATLATGIPGVVVVGAWGFGLLLFSLEPLQNTLAADAVPSEDRGLAFGMTFLSVFGLGSIGAVLAGYLLGTGRHGLLFAALAGTLALSGVCALFAGDRLRAARGR